MRYIISSILILTAFSFQATMGAPRSQYFICDYGEDYKIISQEDVLGTAMTGDYSVSGASGREHYPLRSAFFLPQPLPFSPGKNSIPKMKTN